MAESNWALKENGATVVAVSCEASHMSSTADNLLVDREDQLWIAGEAPQSVTLKLSASHSPLNYAGWHVWHDYMTNPKRVEIASGESMTAMVPLLVCQALPGAGTQVWKLPKPIPQEHRYVRFTIAETFGPGLTYMNSVVLLANDPGPDCRGDVPAVAAVGGGGSASPRAIAERGSEDGRAAPSLLQLQTAPPAARSRSATLFRAGVESSATPRGRSLDERPLRATSVGVGAGYDARHPLAGSPFLVSPRPTSSLRCASDPGDDNAGVFTRAARGVANTPTAPPFGTPIGASAPLGGGRGGPSSGRVNQLLRDLDEDIRSLRPIRPVSPQKDMLLYVPQNQPILLAGPARGGEGSDYSSRSDSSASERGGMRRRHRRRRWGRGGEGSDGNGSGSRGREDGSRPATRSSQSPQQPLQQQQQPAYADVPLSTPVAMTIVGGGTGAAVTTGLAAGGLFDHIAVLEQSVASLSQTVQHQREDITMMKRLLLQQAQERRREVEHVKQQQQEQQYLERKREEKWQRCFELARRERESAKEMNRSALSVAAAAPSPSTTHDAHPTHHHVEVDFPEAALRGFVEAVLEEKLKKNLKKAEARILHRMDHYLRDVVARIADGVDERVRWHLEQADERQHAQRQGQMPAPAAFGIPAMSIDQTMLSGTSGGANGHATNGANVSGTYCATPPQHSVQPAHSGLFSSGAPSPVIPRTEEEAGAAMRSAVSSAAPPPAGRPSLHKYAVSSGAPPSHSSQPPYYAENRYAPA